MEQDSGNIDMTTPSGNGSLESAVECEKNKDGIKIVENKLKVEVKASETSEAMIINVDSEENYNCKCTEIKTIKDMTQRRKNIRGPSSLPYYKISRPSSESFVQRTRRKLMRNQLADEKEQSNDALITSDVIKQDEYLEQLKQRFVQQVRTMEKSRNSVLPQEKSIWRENTDCADQRGFHKNLQSKVDQKKHDEFLKAKETEKLEEDEIDLEEENSDSEEKSELKEVKSDFEENSSASDNEDSDQSRHNILRKHDEVTAKYTYSEENKSDVEVNEILSNKRKRAVVLEDSDDDIEVVKYVSRSKRLNSVEDIEQPRDHQQPQSFIYSLCDYPQPAGLGAFVNGEQLSSFDHNGQFQDAVDFDSQETCRSNKSQNDIIDSSLQNNDDRSSPLNILITSVFSLSDPSERLNLINSSLISQFPDLPVNNSNAFILQDSSDICSGKFPDTSQGDHEDGDNEEGDYNRSEDDYEADDETSEDGDESDDERAEDGGDGKVGAESDNENNIRICGQQSNGEETENYNKDSPPLSQKMLNAKHEAMKMHLKEKYASDADLNDGIGRERKYHWSKSSVTEQIENATEIESGNEKYRCESYDYESHGRLKWKQEMEKMHHRGSLINSDIPFKKIEEEDVSEE